MKNPLAAFLLLVSTLILAFSPPPQGSNLPVAIDDAVLSLTVEDLGRPVDGSTRAGLILAFWEDGRTVWSEDLLNGGAPYRQGQVDPARIQAVQQQARLLGLFDDPALERSYVGSDAAFNVLTVKAGDANCTLTSWHRLYESDGKLVATAAGLTALEGRSRLAVLQNEEKDFLLYRFLWSDLENRLLRLIPAESSPLPAPDQRP
jgi:hypothetical protein